jgi:hypothetical protein
MSNYPYAADERYPDDEDHQAYLSEYNTRVYGVEPEWLTRHEAVAASDVTASGGQYSVDTDEAVLRIRRPDGSVTTVYPSAAWEATSSSLSAPPTPASPGAIVSQARRSALRTRDGAYLRTDLATSEGAVNWQVFRFDVTVPPSSARRVSLVWYGHGEPTAGHPTLVAWWSPSGSWTTLRNAMTGTDTEVGTSWLPGNATFCLRCHDNAPPLGVVMPSGVAAIASVWSTSGGDAHSARAGSGSSYLRPGFVTGMDLPCQACHDTHGNKNLYHLTPFPGDAVGVSVTTPNGMKAVCSGCHAGTVATWHGACIGCHSGWGHGGSFIDSPEAGGAAGYPNESSNCLLCHNHGSKSYVRSDNGRGVDERAQVLAYGDRECHYCHYWDTTF